MHKQLALLDDMPEETPVKYQRPSEKLLQQMQVMLSSESNEWYTPPFIVESARRVMGEIYLDPATNEAAQELIVKAKKFYTVNENGLRFPWYGRVWLNPPYGQWAGKSSQKTWSDKLVYEYRKGNVIEACLLVKAALGYKWFESLWDRFTGCFFRERVSFIRGDGSDEGASKHGTVVFYLGPNIQRFTVEFVKYGRVTDPFHHKFSEQKVIDVSPSGPNGALKREDTIITRDFAWDLYHKER